MKEHPLKAFRRAGVPLGAWRNPLGMRFVLVGCSLVGLRPFSAMWLLVAGYGLVLVARFLKRDH